MWRVISLVLATAATFVACSSNYGDGSTATATDSGVDASDAGVTIADSGNGDTSSPVDSGSDATTSAPDAGYPFADPSFQDGAPWTTSRAASIDPKGRGVDDLGIAILSANLGIVSQTITTGPLTSTMHPALSFRFRASRDFAAPGYDPIGPFADGKPLFDVIARGLPSGVQTATSIFCLGEAFFGGKHLIEFRGLEGGFSILELDHVDLVEDLSCPRNVGIVNGNAETSDGWTLLSDATYQAGAGVKGSRSFRFGPLNSNAGTIKQTILVPKTSIASPALTFHRSGAGTITVSFDDNYVARSLSTGPEQTETVCFPSWLRGIPTEVAIHAGRADTIDVDELGLTMDVDDIAIVNEPSCADSANPDNRGFEGGDSIPGWYVGAGAGYSVARGTASPHTGTGYLVLKSTPEACGASSGYRAHASQPFIQANGFAAGARIRFFYRLTATGTAVAMLDGEALAPAATWTEKTMCLDVAPDGARKEIQFSLDGIAQGCGDTELDIDDVVLDTDPSCPHE